MLDLPGFGQSDPLPDDVSMRSFADDVADVVKQLRIAKVIFCGLSMGGYIGWEFANHHAELLEGLICCNTRADGDDETTARARKLAASQVLKVGTEPIALTMGGKLFSSATKAGNSALVEQTSGVIRQTAPQSIAQAQLAMAQRQDHVSLLSRIDCKVLVIGGADDTITPASAMREMCSQMSNGTFVEIPDAGHLSPAEKPADFNDAVRRWL